MCNTADQALPVGDSSSAGRRAAWSGKLSDKFSLDAVSNVSESLGLLNGEADLVFANLSAVLNELIG